MARIALGIEYDGCRYAGWQWQRDQITIQSEVEQALSKVASSKITVVCAGRTDAGVHALEQVVHFDSSAEREIRAWVMGVNSYLPLDIRVLWARKMRPDFHARTRAIARYYRYVIHNRPTRSALLRNQVTWYYYPLDVERMQQAAEYLIGDHDFTSFRAQGCQSKSPHRMMHFIRLERQGDQVSMSIAANAFLHHMVRNIMGSLMSVGRGEYPPEWIADVLAARDRTVAGVTAPPDGLYLGGVCYPDLYGIPRHGIFDLLPENAARYEDKVL